MLRRLALAVAFAFVALPVQAQGIAAATVSGNEISVQIALPGGLGADLVLRFEQVVGLNLANLGLTAQVVNPTDPGLLSRLPVLSGVSIPAAFPVLLRIEPPAAGGLSFSGVATLELHTHNLLFTVACPLRLFKAPLDGRFVDVTEYMGMGSYRVRGSTGGFSEFLIVADLRSVDRVIGEKFDRLERTLTDNGALIAAPVLAELTDLLRAARASYASGATLAAIANVEAFVADVQHHSGTDIPDVWRSARDIVNVAGLLRSGGETLRFSLNLKSNQGL